MRVKFSVGASILALVAGFLWLLLASKGGTRSSPGASTSDVRAYPGSDATTLSAALGRDGLAEPANASRLRFETVTTDLGAQFYLTFKLSCVQVHHYLRESVIRDPLPGSLGGVQSDVGSRVGWVVDDTTDGVTGSTGGIGDGRFFELSVVPEGGSQCSVYYYSTDM